MNVRKDDSQNLYAERRARLLERMPERSVAVFPSAPVYTRNNDVEHSYRQDSDLYYLTGFAEPETVAILVKGSADAFRMVVRPRDPEREIWDGRRAGTQGAIERFGADKAFETSVLDDAIDEALAGTEVLIYALGGHAEMDQRVLAQLRKFRQQKRKGPEGPRVVQDPGPILHEMRLFKSAAEVERLQRASSLSAEAHNQAMRAARPGINERELQAVLEGTFRALGSARNGYDCIVAGGDNATILHYHDNDQPIADGGLCLIDAGAEYDYYTADITRTFPVNGRFSDAQRAVYQLVLDAQLASIEASRVGATFDSVHDASVRVLTEGMVTLGLLEGEVDALIADESYKRYYMHRTGHWLGMDVHDVGSYRDGDASRPLEAGMVMTVEPGLYIASDDEEAPEAFRGIGVRIEDDVLITAEGPRVLTDGCPKEIADIEAMMAEPAPTFPALRG
ncbi:MAG: aminopeptidase P N-terminal domain-containing protein [Deltaproteobacteria bacterium]|nr:aminopeptidase P N-terminal domain-containing protein [Deltaproteobacteria bacterium]MCB9786489.1 aminopeptidase P N-terminal domain-containing protein [Deltaproteobacteria bacterium]